MRPCSRFRREAQLAAQLAHPAIVPVYDWDRRGDVAWYTMELAEGGSVADLIARSGPRPIAEVAPHVDLVLDGLSAAHGSGIVHRDLKPENILIDRYRRWRMSDFGIAYIPGETPGGPTGTPAFAAPEQLLGEPQGSSVDCFAIAAIVAFVLSGRPPFGDGDARAILARQLAGGLDVDEFHEALGAWLRRGLAITPDDRFPDAAAMQRAWRMTVKTVSRAERRAGWWRRLVFGGPAPGAAASAPPVVPVVISAAVMPEPVAAYAGAPQSIYSDHFLHTQPLDGPIGYKLEVPPVHPVLFATTTPGFGHAHAQLLADMPHLQVVIALTRDGFHPESPGGTVGLRGDGTPLLDYPITPYVWDGARRALKTMAQIQFAAGARTVVPVHEDAHPVTSVAEAERMIDALPLEILRANVVSAHVMGGCPIGADVHSSVVDGLGRYHHLDNVYVFDGSAFPTSIGANPQLSVYGTVARNAAGLAATLAKR